MRYLIFWSFCLAVVPWAAFGQTSHWDSTLRAAQKAYGRGQYREAESQFVQAEKEAESFGPLDHRLAMTLNNLADSTSARPGTLRRNPFSSAPWEFGRRTGMWQPPIWPLH